MGTTIAEVFLSWCWAIEGYINLPLAGISCIMLMYIGNFGEKFIEYIRRSVVYISVHE